MLGTPHPMAAGTSDSDYYAGKVSGPTQNQIDWVRSHRPDDPTLANIGDVVPGAASATQPANVAEEVTA
ncbi:MAG: NADH-quinone oxidoreductase subunit NuoI, partial [Arcanobacterium sp.]|nr:NADH-quinone oxidoreductase subunit NuoI [Arcanobacterium sp.]